jgi:hypothetical protein
MSEREDRFRQHAAECLLLARDTKDPAHRQALIHMAQRWAELAGAAQQDLNTLLKEYNEQMMARPPAVDQPPAQQQQQIQPSSDDKNKE